jgi:hypothetical protein
MKVYLKEGSKSTLVASRYLEEQGCVVVIQSREEIACARSNDRVFGHEEAVLPANDSYIKKASKKGFDPTIFERKNKFRKG